MDYFKPQIESSYVLGFWVQLYFNRIYVTNQVLNMILTNKDLFPVIFVNYGQTLALYPAVAALVKPVSQEHKQHYHNNIFAVQSCDLYRYVSKLISTVPFKRIFWFYVYRPFNQAICLKQTKVDSQFVFFFGEITLSCYLMFFNFLLKL